MDTLKRLTAKYLGFELCISETNDLSWSIQAERQQPHTKITSESKIYDEQKAKRHAACLVWGFRHDVEGQKEDFAESLDWS